MNVVRGAVVSGSGGEFVQPQTLPPSRKRDASVTLELRQRSILEDRPPKLCEDLSEEDPRHPIEKHVFVWPLEYGSFSSSRVT